jgi:hypothetical protein
VSVSDRVCLSMHLSFRFIFAFCVFVCACVCECAIGLASQKMNASVSMYVHLFFFQLLIRVVMLSGVCGHVSRIHVSMLGYFYLCAYQRIVFAYTCIVWTCLFAGRSIFVVLSVRSCE